MKLKIPKNLRTASYAQNLLVQKKSAVVNQQNKITENVCLKKNFFSIA